MGCQQNQRRVFKVNREALFDLMMLLAVVGMFGGVVMMVGTTFYLNRSKDRFRLFELGYSKESIWYRKGGVDFFTANFVIGQMVLSGLRMRGGWGAERARRCGSSFAPNLHMDENYLKFLSEFPVFVGWELIKLFFGLSFLVFGGIAYGIKSGWW